MTMPKPDQVERHAARILAAASRMVADPNDLEVRRDYIHATFNLDFTAAAIVLLGRLATPTEQERSEAALALLGRAREYVADALDAYEHSDGRDLLAEIDAALARAAGGEDGR